jgi:hypothetical protein
MFQDFIVLGIIPGTNFQISFQQWLTAIVVAALAYFTITHWPTVKMQLMIWRIQLAIATRVLEVK